MSSNSDNDETRELLEKLVSDLYGAASKNSEASSATRGANYLEADDGQFLGKITANTFDTESILNEYGPYGSKYSGTSIFNPYCPYGGQYGHYSPENPYTSTPPRLIIGGREIGKVSANRYVENRIPVESFLYSLKNDINGLLAGVISRDEIRFRDKTGDVYIQAADGAFLGSLNPNRFDTNSIFNRYGEYGSQYGSQSIFNKHGTYGGRYSIYSPYNPTTQNPPGVFVGGKKVAYLTVNERITPRIHPDQIFSWAESNVKKRYG